MSTFGIQWEIVKREIYRCAICVRFKVSQISARWMRMASEVEPLQAQNIRKEMTREDMLDSIILVGLVLFFVAPRAALGESPSVVAADEVMAKIRLGLPSRIR